RPTPTRHDDVTITPRTGCGSSPRPHARRVATLGALVALLTTAAGVVLALDGSDAGNGTATVKLAIPVAANSAVRVDLTNTARTLRGHATGERYCDLRHESGPGLVRCRRFRGPPRKCLWS